MPLFYDWAKIRGSDPRNCSTKKKFKESDQGISGRKTRKKRNMTLFLIYGKESFEDFGILLASGSQWVRFV